MKIKLSELRKMIAETIENLNEDVNPAMMQNINKIVQMFPSMVTNQILDQKMGLQGADNRTRQEAVQQTKEWVDQATAKLEQELQAVIQKHVQQTVQGFNPTGAQPAAGQRPLRPATGTAPDQRPTMMPPRMG